MSAVKSDRKGEANPNYRHGLRQGVMIRGWNVAAKGETCCRNCGSSGGRLHLHHVVPRSVCPPAARQDLRNGLALCTSCHSRWHAGTLTLARSIFTADEWVYIASLRLTGRSITGWLDKHYPEAVAA